MIKGGVHTISHMALQPSLSIQHTGLLPSAWEVFCWPPSPLLRGLLFTEAPDQQHVVIF